MTFLDSLNSPKCDFTLNLRGGKIIKFQQSQVLTSHFESFWSIVLCYCTIQVLLGPVAQFTSVLQKCTIPHKT